MQIPTTNQLLSSSSKGNNLRTCPATSQCKKLDTSSYLQTATFSQQSHEYSNRNKKSRLSSLFVSGSRKSQPTTQSSKENLPTNRTSASSIGSSSQSVKNRSSSNSSLSTASSLSQSPSSSSTSSSSSSSLKHKKTNESASLNKSADEMQQRSPVRNLRVRKLGHVEASEEEIVSKWLEKNPSFVFEWFVSHATRFMVDQWMLRQRKLNSNGFLDDQQQQREFRRSNRSASELLTNERKSSLDPQLLAGNNSLLMRSFSCCDTPATKHHVSSPMRKISARHFENSTISLEPIFRRTNEGKLSFLPVDKPLNSISLSPKKHLVNRLSNSLSSQISEYPYDSMIINHHHQHHHFEKHSNSHSQSDQTINRSSLIQNTPDEVKLMLELIQHICNDLDIRSICHKILKNISILTNADRCSLFLVKESANEKYFVSILFDVSSDSEYSDTKQTCIRVPWNSGESDFHLPHYRSYFKCTHFSTSFLVNRIDAFSPSKNIDQASLAMWQRSASVRTFETATATNGSTVRSTV